MKANTPAPLAGLVLCGGTSRRMGSDKALMHVDGEPLVLRVARRLSTVADPVLLATGVPGRFGQLGLREVPDARPLAGPLAGVVAGLEASPHPLVAVIAADMPFASPEVLRLLVLLRVDEDVVAPVTSSGIEPLHAVYARGALPELRTALDEDRFSLRSVLGRLRVRKVVESEWRSSDPTGRFALNLNRPEDVSLLAGT